MIKNTKRLPEKGTWKISRYLWRRKNKKQENGSERCKIIPKDGNPRLVEYRKNVENMEVCEKKTVLRK